MNYEARRISFQDSEQAAKADFEESQRWERLFAMAIGSVVELTEAAGIRKEDQLLGGTTQALNAIEKLKERREKWKARALKAEQWNREMVAKAASNHLEGYRELGLRAATLETARDELASQVTSLREDVANLLRLVGKIRAAAGDPKGKLMQPELIAHIAATKDEYDALAVHMERVVNEWNAGDCFSDEWINRMVDIVEDAPACTLSRSDTRQAEGDGQ